MSVSITSKLPAAGTTIFTVMSALAQQHKAINLGQGFPDYPMDEALITLVNEAMLMGNNQYVHMNGLPLLRERLSEKVNESYKAKVNPDTDITITPGGTYAIYTALTAILQRGDEVIYFEPAYDSYVPGILLNGGIPVPVKLSHPDYTINWDEVAAKINNKTRAIIINTPHNPSGKVMSAEDMQRLITVTRNTPIIIISDEVYEHLIFDEKIHYSVLRYPELMERSFVCFSFGKAYHCTGWKMGYIISNAVMMNEFRKVHQFNVFTCNTPVQVALAAYLLQKEKYEKLGLFLQQKRDYFQKLMNGTSFIALPSYGSYFQLYDYSKISNESEMDFAMRLTVEYGVTAIPVSAFYSSGTDNKLLRFCFAKSEKTLEQAAEKLVQL